VSVPTYVASVGRPVAWLSGLDLQREPRQDEQSVPIIFSTGHGDIPMTVKA